MVLPQGNHHHLAGIARRKVQRNVARTDGSIAAYASYMGTSRQTAYDRTAKLSQVLGERPD